MNIVGIGVGIEMLRMQGSGGPPVSTKQYDTYANSLITYSAGDGLKETYDDSTTQVRKRVLGNSLYIDVTLTPTGFSGSEGIDWETRIVHTGQNNRFRMGYRDGIFAIDCTITGTGFSGSEDIDWENIESVVGGTGQTTYRDGVRGTAYVIDQDDGAGGWENIEEHLT